MDVEALIRERVRTKHVRVPPAPTGALQLSHLLSELDWGMAELERIVRSDPAVAAVVLRSANAIGVRGRDAISTIPQAVSRLGAHGVMKIAWASAAKGSLEAPGPLLVLRQRAWREAIVAAHVAQWLSGRLAPHDAETSFVIGMLHDIGRVVVLSALEEILVAHPDADTRTLDGWWALAEDLHQSAGGALVEAWQLPHPLAAAVAFHHQLGAWEWLSTVNDVVAQIEVSPRVTHEALGHIAGLDTATCLELATRLPELVEAVRMLDPALPGPDATSPYELGAVSISTGDASARGTVIAVDQAGLIVATDVELKTRLLVFVRTEGLEFHAKLEREGDLHRLRPWALRPEQAAAFEGFRVGMASAA